LDLRASRDERANPRNSTSSWSTGVASGQRAVRAIGEARIRNRKATMDDLHRRETVRDRLGQLDAKLVIASAEGFTRELEQQDRRRRDLELVDAERLYEGS